MNNKEMTAWIAGDCWLIPGGAAVDLRQLWGGACPELAILNLECAVRAGTPREGRRALLALDPARLPEIAIAQNTVCVLANNHTTDFGPEGLLATLEVLRQAGIRPLGAGACLAEARAPVIIEVAGRRVGMLAYSDTALHVGSVAATAKAPGVARFDPEMITADLRRLAPDVDDLWLFLHWGLEWIRYPEPVQRDLARAFAEAGADLIVGIHPHVVRGTERISNSLAYYSLGNFVFPPIPLCDGAVLRWERVCREGLALKGTVERGGWIWSETPHVISIDGSPHPPGPDDEEAMRREFADLSIALTDKYVNGYPSLRRKEMLRHFAWRLWTMSWRDRARLIGRRAHSALQRS